MNAGEEMHLPGLRKVNKKVQVGAGVLQMNIKVVHPPGYPGLLVRVRNICSKIALFLLNLHD